MQEFNRKYFNKRFDEQCAVLAKFASYCKYREAQITFGRIKELLVIAKDCGVIEAQEYDEYIKAAKDLFYNEL